MALGNSAKALANPLGDNAAVGSGDLIGNDDGVDIFGQRGGRTENLVFQCQRRWRAVDDVEPLHFALAGFFAEHGLGVRWSEPLRPKEPIGHHVPALEFGAKLEAVAVVADDADSVNRPGAEGNEIVDDGSRCARAVANRDDLMGHEAGLDRRLGKRWIDDQIAIQKVIADDGDTGFLKAIE